MVAVRRMIGAARVLKLSNAALMCRSVANDGPALALAKARIRIRQIVRGEARSGVAEATGGRGGSGPLGRIWCDLARGQAFHLTSAPALIQRQRRLAVIGDLNLPQCRKYRVEQLAELWACAGIDVAFSHHEDVPRAIGILQSATHLLFYRVPRSDLVTTYLYEARRLRLPVAFDIDDPLFSVPAYETYGNMALVPAELKAQFLRDAPLYHDVMNAADVLTLSTPALRDEAARFVPRPAFLRRNFADRETLDAGRRAAQGARVPDAPFTVAFASGSRGHDADLQTILPALCDVLMGGADRRLLLIGHVGTDLFPPEVRARVVTQPFGQYGDYLAALARADCAVLPLADDLFNRCKSGVRVIDAAAVAVPSIVGTVGDLATLVRHGRTGLVAAAPADWREGLEALARDRAGTAAMGARARADLEDRWSACRAPHIVEPGLTEWLAG